MDPHYLSITSFDPTTSHTMDSESLMPPLVVRNKRGRKVCFYFLRFTSSSLHCPSLRTSLLTHSPRSIGRRNASKESPERSSASIQSSSSWSSTRSAHFPVKGPLRLPWLISPLFPTFFLFSIRSGATSQSIGKRESYPPSLGWCSPSQSLLARPRTHRM
jgi:hypothetical protein